MKRYKLGELIEVTRGASLSGKYYSTEGAYIRLTLGNFNLKNGGFQKNISKDNIYFTGNFDKKFLLSEGDIITPLTEQTYGLLGCTARIPKNGLYIQSQDVALIKCDENKIDSSFCYYLMSSPIVKKQLSAAAQQTKIRHTSPDKIKNIIVEIPDIDYQRKSGKILDYFTKKIELNINEINELEAYSKFIFGYYFLQPNIVDTNAKLTYNSILRKKVPDSWSIKNIKDIADMYQPETISGKELVEDGEYFVYGANGIIGKYDKYNHEESEIAITCRGASCGNIIVTLPKCWITGNAMIIKPKNDFAYKEYLYYYLSYIDINGVISGSAQPQITRANLENLKVIIPDNYLLEKYEKIACKIRNQINLLLIEINELQDKRQLMISLLVNGQLKI